ncbi:hypothetical protein BY996DRAFT_6426096 [Phakopsora pachyrhizi]|nr:hypothetical protein BY996DRAFT_6426096 [Phakopsora pachyrhizi]
MVGGTIEKLIRHQPSLKKTVLEANVNFLNGIHEIAAPQSDLVNANDVLMSKPASGPANLLLQSTLDAVNKKEMDEKDVFFNRAVLFYVDVDCRLLESMLQNVAHSQYLTLMQGFDIKLSLLRLPSIPYNFLTTTDAKASASTICLLTKTLPLTFKTQVIMLTNELPMELYLPSQDLKTNVPKPWPYSTGTTTINPESGIDSSSTILPPLLAAEVERLVEKTNSVDITSEVDQMWENFVNEGILVKNILNGRNLLLEIEFLTSDLTWAEYNNCNNKNLELGLGFLNDASP